MSTNNFRPATSTVANGAEMARLLDVKELAVRAEATLKQSVDTALSVFRRSSGGTRNAAATLLGAPQVSGSAGYEASSIFSDQFESTPSYASALIAPSVPEVASRNPFLPHASVLPPMPDDTSMVVLAKAFLTDCAVADDYTGVMTEALDQATKATAFLSAAEKALRDASGTSSPIECWGCTNDPRFHDNRFHRFMNCPHKNDSEVRKRANLAMSRLFGERRNSDKKRSAESMLTSELLTADDLKHHWKDYGFASSTQAAMALALLSKNTSNTERKKMTIMENRQTRSSALTKFNQKDDTPCFMFIPASADKEQGIAMSAVPPQFQ